MYSPTSKKVATTCLASSRSRNFEVRIHGPSSNVSAISLRRVSMLLTNDAPLGTQPTTCGVCRRASAGRPGNSTKQPIRLAFGGLQAGGRSVLITCQRSDAYERPASLGRNVAVKSWAPLREICAGITLSVPGPLRVIGAYATSASPPFLAGATMHS